MRAVFNIVPLTKCGGNLMSSVSCVDGKADIDDIAGGTGVGGRSDGGGVDDVSPGDEICPPLIW